MKNRRFPRRDLKLYKLQIAILNKLQQRQEINKMLTQSSNGISQLPIKSNIPQHSGAKFVHIITMKQNKTNNYDK